VYAAVYDAQRPELFFKSIGWRVRGSGEAIGIRSDSTWDVPEPELAVVCGAAGDIVGATICNDVSSRSIEGENPLYLPQAKIFHGACAVGPWIRLVRSMGPLTQLDIVVEIRRRTQWCGPATHVQPGCIGGSKTSSSSCSAPSGIRTASSSRRGPRPCPARTSRCNRTTRS